MTPAKQQKLAEQVRALQYDISAYEAVTPEGERLRAFMEQLATIVQKLVDDLQ